MYVSFVCTQNFQTIDDMYEIHHSRKAAEKIHEFERQWKTTSGYFHTTCDDCIVHIFVYIFIKWFFPSFQLSSLFIAQMSSLNYKEEAIYLRARNRLSLLRFIVKGKKKSFLKLNKNYRTWYSSLEKYEKNEKHFNYISSTTQLYTYCVQLFVCFQDDYLHVVVDKRDFSLLLCIL